MDRRHDFLLTRIIATIGPSCREPDQVARMVEEGVRVFRINFSHGGFPDYDHFLGLVRDVSARLDTPVAVLGDLSGPKIRIGEIQDDGLDVAPGQTLEVVRPDVHASLQPNGTVTLSTTWPDLLDDVQAGQRLLIDDGAVRALVTEVVGDAEDRRLRATVTAGGRLSRRKGLNLPDTTLRVPSITDWDWRCVAWAMENDLDFLALSFVRRAEDLRELKAYLDSHHRPSSYRMPLIAKIEKPEAVRDLESIVQEADGVMVARGDLGVEMDLAEVPGIQKQIVRICRDLGKPVIVATQMLQSMIDSPWPTRAEVSDVANAIYEGVDAVMLSGETAVGRYPFEVVNMMARTARAAQRQMEAMTPNLGPPPRRAPASRYRTAALAHGVTAVVRDLQAKFIVVWSQRGGGARYLSQTRPTIPILAFSHDMTALRRMCNLFGVTPVHMPLPPDVPTFVARMDRVLLDRGWAEPGASLVVVVGEPLGVAGVTNTLRIHYVGDAVTPDRTLPPDNPASSSRV